jgi:hypothetical protein
MGTFTLFFDGSFWVGIATRQHGATLEIARVVFGPEPSDAELAAWMHAHYRELCFVPSEAPPPEPRLASNPKRRRREVQRALEQPRTSTRAQEAWQAALSALKPAQRAHARQARRAEAEQRYAARAEKRKQKRRGK